MFIILYIHYLSKISELGVGVEVKISNLNKYLILCCPNGKGTTLINVVLIMIAN